MKPKYTSQRIGRVALKDIVPADYQRPTNANQVANIVTNFDEAKLGTLHVSEHDGVYNVIDGQHRATVLKQLGYTHAACVIETGLTYEQDAELYRSQNQNKRRLSPADFFKAGLEADDVACRRINDVVNSNGFHVNRGSKDFYKINAIDALFTVYTDFDDTILDQTLCLIASTWPGLARASTSDFLLGVAEFVSRYGMVDFADRMKDKYAAICFEYSEAMKNRGAAGSVTSRKKFCKVLMDNYNKGLVHNSKKRLKWEEA